VTLSDEKNARFDIIFIKYSFYKMRAFISGQQQEAVIKKCELKKALKSLLQNFYENSTS